jgi:EamA domain-containing membrane protein RarD
LVSIAQKWLVLLFCLAFLSITVRVIFALRDLSQGDMTTFLAFPLTVILPGLAFVFVGRLKDMRSEEGALMQIGVMIQLILILSLPSLALFLALGFPVVFLAVELFETRAPAELRKSIKRYLLK